MKTISCALILAVALSGPASAGLEQAADLSRQAAEARGAEASSDAARRALEAGLPSEGLVPSVKGAPGRPAAPLARPRPTISERLGRPVGQEPPGPGRAASKLAKGAAGALVGAALGAVIGLAAGGVLLGTTLNPKLRRWRYALILPGAVAGAVVGQCALPYALARIFYDAKRYSKPAFLRKWSDAHAQ